MNQTNQNSLFVFKEQTHLFGLLPADFDTYVPLNQLWISPYEKNSQLWRFEGKQTNQKGYFIHPALLFGFKEIHFNQSGILFLKQISPKKSIGLVMNDFLMRIVNKKFGPKAISTDLAKNFPPDLPKSAFHYIQRFKRKNILVLNPEGLIREYNIDWPD